ncbi:hypothetical protein GOP47_0011732 [Adiantum capillus-veneris]|uniref:Protein SPIRAL1-like 1 n=1 Tax=Adiantum capillus-veneris TaxID=13818 RepID=A0A9D4ZFN6_ADICA|nr:hypothetical protein GOP47_0011732 [Adiantum capillus-veneris]
MGRGVSYGGGQSSLGYLFGSDEPPKAAPSGTTGAPPTGAASAVKESTPPPNQLGSNPNNYHRADGQNTGNFITDRPSTKVHSAPGGGSSLGYLFGGGD